MIGVGSPGNQLPSSLETRLTGHGKAGTGPHAALHLPESG
jgi:hypothetical protein